MTTYELLTEFRFSFKDSGIIEVDDALEFVDEFVYAAINKIHKSYNVTYQIGSDYDNRFACGKYFYRTS